MSCWNSVETRVRRVLLLLLMGAGSACGDGEAETGALESNGTPVILISIDSLRADYCSAYGYQARFAPDERTTPFLEAMAGRGTNR